VESSDHVTAAFLLAAVGLHAGFVATGFVLHWVEAQNRGVAPPALSYARAYLLEWWFTFGMLLLWPLGWLLPRLPRRFLGHGGPPILLVHGYMMNRTSMFALYWRLARAGYRNVYTVNLKTWRGVRRCGGVVAQEIREISRLAGGARVIVVGHSMGGVIGRWCVSEDDTLPVDRIVTFCSPHKGTRLAVLGLDPGAWDLRIGSRLLRDLPEATRVPLFAIWAQIDNVVVPSENAAFGPVVVEMPEAGHMTPLYEARGFEALLVALETPAGARAA
jgi:pimeloyl-ACP methyl ester carboxylesterase